MLGLLVPLAVLAVSGLVLLWPAAGEDGGWDPTALGEGTTYVSGTVTMVDLRECPDAESSGCAAITVEVDGAEGSLFVPPEAMRAGLAPGDRVKAIGMDAEAASDPAAEAITGGPGEAPPGGAAPDPGDPGAADYVFVDFDRNVSLTVLAAVYALLVVLVAGLRGLRALLGLVFAFGLMLVFMLPALLAGSPAVLVGVVAAAVIMLVVLYLAHGFSARTTTALLGTLAGIAVTGVLGALWTRWAKLAGIYSEETYLLSWSAELSTGDLVVCGILIAGLGVLNDVTITQAAAVWELALARPHARARELFASAMRIGRDHIASTVYTIAFAFAGGGLTVLLLVASSSRSFLESLTLGDLAIEVVSLLVCSIGLVLAIPATTAIAALVVRSGEGVRPRERDRGAAVPGRNG